MKNILIFLFFVLALLQGCAIPKKEKIGPISGKAYDCRNASEAAAYKKECDRDERNKCLAELPGLSATNKKLIEEGRIAIGMNKDQVRCSYGEPAKINRTELRTIIFEQWIYGEEMTGAVCLYFQNGVLVSSHDL